MLFCEQFATIKSNYYIIAQMANLENGKLILENYSFKRDKPFFSSPNYEVHNGFHKETKLPVTIKIHHNFHPELPRYLKKLKQCKSQNIIRVYELAVDSASLVIITEYAIYGNLASALKRCQRLEESDAISVAKLMLNGYVDLLRSDCTWVGTEQDVEFTENGIKLSWNNTHNFKSSPQSQQCLSKIIQRLSTRSQTQKCLLPFPKSKIIEELINVSKQSASEISLNSQVKKKQKPCKKKGKNWNAIKQISSKNQYIQEAIYLAVNTQYGFVKIKIYEKGYINPQILTLNKTKQSFTQVFDCYEQNGKTIIISNYSNDGSMQGYVSKLKSTAVKLTEQHIQFLFFSLFEPLKQVQNSNVKSIGMLNIKNIYLQNGIPKIGEPIPMSTSLELTLKDRQSVPDFYHSRFKRQPNSKSQIYDTYSLGVLLYKLMYTEYPIFPQGKVHIPTAPNFNKRLKTTLQILLNEGGSLQSIQSKIQISETVVRQVKQNKKILQKIQEKEMKVHKKSIQLSKRAIIEDLEDDEQHETKEDKTEHKSEQQNQFQDEIHCCCICWHALDQNPAEAHLNRFTNITALEICTKVVLVLLFYIFLFYFFFLQSNFNFLSSQSKLQTYNVTIATKVFPIITDNPTGFQTEFNKTTRALSSLTGLGCLIDDFQGGPNYSNFFISNPSGWIGYLVASLLSFVVMMVLKAWKTYHFDLVRAIYNWDHGKFNYNITNFIIYNLQFSCFIFGHYYLFNLVFDGQMSPCYGSVNYYYHSSYTLLNDSSKFLVPYMVTFIGQSLIVALHWIMKWRTHQIGYNKLINPIIIFCPFLIAQWIVLRIGAVSGYFYPNGLQQNTVIKSYFLNGKYIDILGTIPQILWICEVLIGAVVDIIYWFFLDKRRRLLIQDTSAASLDETIK